MLRFRPTFALLGLGALLAGAMAPAARAVEPRSWTFTAIAPDQSVFADIGHNIIDRLEKNLRGEVKFKRRFNGILGDELVTTQMVKQGRVEAWGGSLGAMMSVVPELQSLELPFIFKDYATLRATLQRLKRGRASRISAAFERHGLVLVTLGMIGWRNLSSTDRPIRTVDDLKGLRARSQDAEVHLAMWRAFGASPKTTSLNDLAGAFDFEKFQVLDVPASFLYATSVDSKIKYLTLTRHMPQLACVVIHKAAWEKIPKDKRARAFDGLDEVLDKAGRAADAFDEELHGMMRKKGITIIEPSPAERERFRAAAQPVAAAIGKSASPAERDMMKEIAQAIAEVSK